jgi:SAM-dependent methyltransferase
VSTPHLHGHPALDLKSRLLKAQKIERLLEIDRVGSPLDILEIGCGSGGIAHYLGTRPAQHQVKAVDVFDSRVVVEGFEFQIVEGTELPFHDGSFDVVISNHVIEHVGPQPAQLAHLGEIRRVLKPSGVGYLAVPNRWRLIEPHYRLPLLSVWPSRWRTPYLRLLRKGTEYDCVPLELGKLEAMFRREQLRYRRLGPSAVRATLEIEHAWRPLAALARLVPDRALSGLQRLMPTLTYRIERA